MHHVATRSNGVWSPSALEGSGWSGSALAGLGCCPDLVHPPGSRDCRPEVLSAIPNTKGINGHFARFGRHGAVCLCHAAVWNPA